jgi:hypothetical protein
MKGCISMQIYKNFDPNKEIKTIDDWFSECPPKQKMKHWKDGRSAKELARYVTMMLPEVPFELYNIFSKYSSMDQITVAPEFVTRLKSKGFGSGEGRNHDSLILLKDAVIGIEAKADEGLDKYYLNINIDDTLNHQLRYRGLYSALFNDHIDGKVRYQLVSASVGTILEAIDRRKPNAVLLIITFLRDGCYDMGKVKYNYDDIKYFIDKFERREDGSLLAKIAVDNNVHFYFEHISIRLDTNTI